MSDSENTTSKGGGLVGTSLLVSSVKSVTEIGVFKLFLGINIFIYLNFECIQNFLQLSTPVT